MNSSNAAAQASGAQARGVAPNVVLCGVLPPPRNGMAIVTSHVLAALQNAGLLLAQQDITVGREVTGINRHFAKARKVLQSMALLHQRRNTPGRCFYTHCDANSGKIYTLLLCLVARIYGYRTYLHHHSYFYINQYSPLIALIAKIMGVGGRHILLCECMEKDFAARYAPAMGGPVPTEVVHNRVWFPRRQADKPFATDTITLGHLGNLTWEKGSGAFIDLFEALRGRGVDARAILLGDTPDEKLNAKIRDVAQRFPDTFTHLEDPAPTQAIKDGFFNDIDYFVMPTQYKVEAQPLVLIEARAMGVPVIATARGCIRDDHEGAPNLIVDADADFVEVAGGWLAERQFASVPAGARRAPEPDIGADLEHFRQMFADTAAAPARAAVMKGATA